MLSIMLSIEGPTAVVSKGQLVSQAVRPLSARVLRAALLCVSSGRACSHGALSAGEYLVLTMWTLSAQPSDVNLVLQHC